MSHSIASAMAKQWNGITDTNEGSSTTSERINKVKNGEVKENSKMIDINKESEMGEKVGNVPSLTLAAKAIRDAYIGTVKPMDKSYSTTYEHTVMKDTDTVDTVDTNSKPKDNSTDVLHASSVSKAIQSSDNSESKTVPYTGHFSQPCGIPSGVSGPTATVSVPSYSVHN